MISDEALMRDALRDALRDDAARVREIVKIVMARTFASMWSAQAIELEGICKDMELAADVLGRHTPCPICGCNECGCKR